MRRREFIAGLVGAVVCPIAVSAQAERMRRIGVLLSMAENDPDAPSRVSAFKQGLDEAGWVEGRNVRMEYRWAGGEAGLLRTYAAELVNLVPDVIVANGTPALTALKTKTADIPIVFVNVADPVGGGFVESFSRPAGNITGYTNYEKAISGKWLEMLRDFAPGLARALVILNSENSGNLALLSTARSVALSVGVELASLDVTDPGLDTAVKEITRRPSGGLIVFPDFKTTVHRERIIALAARYRIPGIYPFRSFVQSGGLMSYGVDSNALYRRGAAAYVDRILRGANPAELPVQAPTKLELVINLKTAKALSLEVPPTLLALADEVME